MQTMGSAITDRITARQKCRIRGRMERLGHSSIAAAEAGGHAMSIRVVCPNGHALQVKNEWAGKTGLCPICKVPVAIPRPSSEDFSEDSIMDLLGRPGAVPAGRRGRQSRQRLAESPTVRSSRPRRLATSASRRSPRKYDLPALPHFRRQPGRGADLLLQTAIARPDSVRQVGPMAPIRPMGPMRPGGVRYRQASSGIVPWLAASWPARRRELAILEFG